MRTQRYEIRSYDEKNRGNLLFEADSEEELSRFVAAEWPLFVVEPYENDDELILCIWKTRQEVNPAPYAVAWKPKEAPSWKRALWSVTR